MLKELGSVRLTRPVRPWIHKHDPFKALAKINGDSGPAEGLMQTAKCPKLISPSGGHAGQVMDHGMNETVFM